MTNETNAMEQHLWELHAVLTDLFKMETVPQLDSLLARYPLYATGTRNLFDFQTNVSIASANAVKHAIYVINNTLAYTDAVLSFIRTTSESQLCQAPSNGTYPLLPKPTDIRLILKSNAQKIEFIGQAILTALQQLKFYFEIGDYISTDNIIDHAERLTSTTIAELNRDFWYGDRTLANEGATRLESIVNDIRDWKAKVQISDERGQFYSVTVPVPEYKPMTLDNLYSISKSIRTLDFQSDLVDVAAARDVCYFMATLARCLDIYSRLVGQYNQLVLLGKDHVCQV